MTNSDKIAEAKNVLSKSPIKAFGNFKLWIYYAPILFNAFIKRLKYSKVRVYCILDEIEKFQFNQSKYFVGNLVILDDAVEIFDQSKSRYDEKVHDFFKKLYHKRIQRGDKLFALRINDETLCSLWVSCDTVFIESVDYWFKLPQHTFAFYDVFTYERYRGKGYYRYFLNLVMTYFREKGFIYYYLWVMRHNQVSIHAHNKLSINRIKQEVLLTRFFGMKRIKMREVDYQIAELI